jgi:CRP/FNR family transcriptional regulator, cyclic AMP receptor protein
MVKKPQMELDVFASIGLMEGLSGEEVACVHAISERVEYPAGREIMHEDELGDSMYLFASGEVDVTKNLTLMMGRGFAQAEKSMVKLRAKDVSFFGDMAVIEQEPRSATITASSDCVLYMIHRDAFIGMCAEKPALGLKLLRRIAVTLCRRVRKGNEDVLKLSTALSIALSKQGRN